MTPSRHSLVLLLATLGWASACADDPLTRRLPTLEVEPFVEGYVYAEVVPETLTINLGQVPVYQVKKAAFKLTNPTSETLVISSVDFAEMLGGEWRQPARLQLAEKWVDAPAYPITLKTNESAILEFTYAPASVEPHQLRASIKSNSTNSVVDVTVMATGIYLGAPDIAVNYGGAQELPLPEHCGADGVCRVPKELGIDMGNIGLGEAGTKRLAIRNTAICPVYPGAEPCVSCELKIDKNAAAQNIGLGIRSDAPDLFRFRGSTATPFTIRQRDLECGASGELKLSLQFTAPQQEGDHEATIVIESNDLDEPIIEIPVIARVRNAPVAVAELRQQDPAHPSEPWSDPNNIKVLSRVYLDGRKSYDPRDPSDRSLITTYQWRVTAYPDGASEADFRPQGNNGLFSFEAPLAGDYEVTLRVTNIDNIVSGDTAQSTVAIHVIPGSRLHVELTWDDPTNDQDLHLTFANGTPCSNEDCYFATCTPGRGPIWSSVDPPRQNGNPHLDIDDTHGLGPENINVDVPQAGVYRVYVDYWGGTQPTRNTVRVWLNGVPRAEYRRILRSSSAFWSVADIIWTPNAYGGEGDVQAYDSDAVGEIGTVRNQECSGGGILP